MLWMLINLRDFACQFYWSTFHAGIKGTLYQSSSSLGEINISLHLKTSVSQRTFTLNSGLLLMRL